MDLSVYFQSISRLTPDDVNTPVKSALTFLEWNNADLTPRIVREGVSGVISAQWWLPPPLVGGFLRRKIHHHYGLIYGFSCSRWCWPVNQMSLWKVNGGKTLNRLLPFKRKVSRSLSVLAVETLFWLPRLRRKVSSHLSPNGHAGAIGWVWDSKVTFAPSMLLLVLKRRW